MYYTTITMNTGRSFIAFGRTIEELWHRTLYHFNTYKDLASFGCEERIVNASLPIYQ